MTAASAKSGGRAGETRSDVPSYTKLVLFLCAVLTAGFAIGLLNPPGQWYSTLSKPPANPPNYVFAPVWSVVYVVIAIAGWRVWEHENNRTGKAIWAGQMALNFAWSPVFFTLHSTRGALVIIIAMLATILAFVARQWSRDRWSALLFAPYVVWVSFATFLNASIVLLNP
ncbi:TspO/MBR family protein [Bradyrhizobium stylosanthis]|uniref:TspO/MBR related protein n=1 Tax=Bradyrhizobium stylosanthis TaxID=1803665 RepID=A0A560D615_9BRAD|nr:TspO/MBR family protein [Bradyrhizobium stylosanthis]TWA92567.1 TspO/MBR related protein [Bradyrhizobium stylosanthis]